MTIKLYSCTDSRDTLNKTLTRETTINNARLIDDTQLLNPMLRLETNPSSYQLVYISTFDRYYFIESYKKVNTYYEVYLSEDYLTSYKSEISSQVALISSTGIQESKQLPDTLPIKARKRVQTKVFPESFSNELSSYVLTTIG